MAPTNSPTKYGNGLILVFLQKKIINGVKVITIMSLDVKIVKIEATKYNKINIDNCEFLAFLTATEAKYLKNPTSSKTTLIKTIEIKIANISSGLTLVGAINDEKTRFESTKPKDKSKIDPINGANQKVCIWIFLILITGKNKTKQIIPIIDKIEITIAAITIGYSTPI